MCNVRYVSGLDLSGLGRVMFGMCQVYSRSVRFGMCHVWYVSGLDLSGLGRVMFGMCQV